MPAASVCSADGVLTIKKSESLIKVTFQIKAPAVGGNMEFESFPALDKSEPVGNILVPACLL